MKRILFYLLSFIIVSCNTTEIYIDVYDPVQAALDSIEQREDDIDLIYSYLQSENINYVDTTNSGVFYSILDEGNNEIFPENNDLVSIHITGYYTNDSIFFTNDSVDLVIFDTNIQSLAESIGYFDPDKYYSCLLYTSPSPRDGLLSRMPSSA